MSEGGTSAPAVDVIVPTRNRPALTVEAVTSVRNQTVSEWRLFVVDDASDDETPDVVAAIAEADDRITIVRRRVSGGANAARQTGFEQGGAPLVAILDSDDLWLPHKLERQLKFWRAHDVADRSLGVLLCWHQYVGEDGRPHEAIVRPRFSRRWHPFTVFNTSAAMMSRAVLAEVGGFVTPASQALCTTDFMDLFLRMTRDHSWLILPELLTYCRNHAGPRNSDAEGTEAAAAESAYLLHLHEGTLDARTSAWMHAWVGVRYLRPGRHDAAVPYLRKALRIRNPLTTAHILAHYGPFIGRALLRRRPAPEPPRNVEEQ